MKGPGPQPALRTSGGLLAALLLAACTAAPPATTTSGDAEPSPVDVMETARLPAPDEPPRSYPEPGSLTEMGEPELREVLGEPGFVRRDPPAEIWQYRTSGCVLHLFLYADAGERLALRHLEARRPEGGETATDDCLRHVIDARPRARAG